MADAVIEVEVVYAWPDRHVSVALRLPAGATVAEAIQAANLGARIEVPLAWAGVAIHGRTASDTTPLRDGDRVELLRPLQTDPKQARRARAARPAQSD